MKYGYCNVGTSQTSAGASKGSREISLVKGLYDIDGWTAKYDNDVGMLDTRIKTLTSDRCVHIYLHHDTANDMSIRYNIVILVIYSTSIS